MRVHTAISPPGGLTCTVEEVPWHRLQEDEGSSVHDPLGDLILVAQTDPEEDAILFRVERAWPIRFVRRIRDVVLDAFQEGS